MDIMQSNIAACIKREKVVFSCSCLSPDSGLLISGLRLVWAKLSRLKKSPSMKRRSLKSLVSFVYNSMMLLFGCYNKKVWADKSPGIDSSHENERCLHTM